MINLEIGTKLKVVKDIYYVVEDHMSEELMTYEELFDQISHLCVVGDIWEVVEEDGERYLQCISGKWEGEYNEGWFDANDMINKGAFETIK